MADWKMEYFRLEGCAETLIDDSEDNGLELLLSFYSSRVNDIDVFISDPDTTTRCNTPI
jgi:hypothetical protein